MSLALSDMAAATQAIKNHSRFLVVPHANVDPDGLSAALSCYQMFAALGKEVTVICPDTLPETLQFLPGFEKLTREIADTENFIVTVSLSEGVEVDKLRYTVEDHKVNIIVTPRKGRIRPQHISFGEGEKRYDLLVIVDTADLALLGGLYTDHIDLFSSVPIVNIDHHISNTRFGQLHLIDPAAASATEVLFSWFMHESLFRDHITPDIATLLLTGLITDTRSFQNPNTTPRSLEVAAELLEKGARQQEIIQHVYKTKPLSTLKIWGRALNRIQVDVTSGIVWSAISKEDLLEMGAESRQTHGILDELLSTIPDASVHVLFTEVEEGGLKASMRSSAAIDASLLAARCFGGGGHARAAGFKVRKFENFQLQVLQCVEKLKEGMAKQRGEDMGFEARGLRLGLKKGERDGTLEEGVIGKTAQEEQSVPSAASSLPAPDPAEGSERNRGAVDIVEKIVNGKKGEDQIDIVKDLAKQDESNLDASAPSNVLRPAS